MRFRSGKVVVEAGPRSGLSDAEREEVWTFAQRFVDTTREVFDANVALKSECVRIRDAKDGALVGFGAVDVHRLPEGAGLPEGFAIAVGNTLFDERYRGQSLVEKAGFRYYARLRLRHPSTPVYLAYGTFSYKSFAMMTRNFETYWPHPEASPTEEIARLVDYLARRYYGEAWDPERQVAVGSTDYRLKAWVAPIDEARLADPAVRYFAEKNPGYQNGDCVFCLIPLTARNWVSVMRSVVRRPRRRTA